MDIPLLLGAAYFAGILNAVAGGGSFLTFPALVYVGLPPIAANATSAVVVLPGYLGSVWGFLDDLRAMDRKTLLVFAIISLVGGALGAGLLLVTPGKVFQGIVPWLLLFATVLFAVGEHLQGWLQRHSRALPRKFSLGIVSLYGGYFNGGLGIMLLALFSAFGMRDLNQMNGLKNGLSFMVSAISVLIFALSGLVAWYLAGLMVGAAVVGGYAGAYMARAMDPFWVKVFIIVIGLIMTVLFF